MKLQLIVIAGPTAVGKTAVAIQVAQQLQTQIISADSRQFYKELSIGTAVPEKTELDKVTHHFIHSHSVKNPVSAGQFENLAIHKISELFKQHTKLILTGGSGLFIDAVCYGVEPMPVISSQIKNKVQLEFQKYGLNHMAQKLQKIDPTYAATADLKNPRRVLRALEIMEQTGKPYSTFRLGVNKVRPFSINWFCLNLPREVLYNQINYRVDKMIELGLENEARKLFQLKHLTSLNTVSYSEFFDYFEGKTNKQRAIELIKQNSRNYAKRQLTWFRKNKNYHWIDNSNPSKTVEEILNKISL